MISKGPETIELNPSHEIFATISRFIAQPFGLVTSDLSYGVQHPYSVRQGFGMQLAIGELDRPSKMEGFGSAPCWDTSKP